MLLLLCYGLIFIKGGVMGGQLRSEPKMLFEEAAKVSLSSNTLNVTRCNNNQCLLKLLK